MLLDQRRSLILDFEQVYVAVSQITVSWQSLCGLQSVFSCIMSDNYVCIHGMYICITLHDFMLNCIVLYTGITGFKHMVGLKSE